MNEKYRKLDNDIRSINRKIETIFNKFGAESVEYQKFETILQGIMEDKNLVKMEIGKPIKILRNKAALMSFSDKGFLVNKLKRQETYSEIQKKLIESYKKRNPNTKFSKKDYEKIAKEQSHYETKIMQTFEHMLGRLYELEKNELGGVETLTHEELRKIGREKDDGDYERIEKMIDVMKDELSKEKHEINENYLQSEGIEPYYIEGDGLA